MKKTTLTLGIATLFAGSLFLAGCGDDNKTPKKHKMHGKHMIIKKEEIQKGHYVIKNGHVYKHVGTVKKTVITKDGKQKVPLFENDPVYESDDA